MIPVQRSAAARYVACDLFATLATIVVSGFPLHGEAPIAFDPWSGRLFSGGVA